MNGFRVPQFVAFLFVAAMLCAQQTPPTPPCQRPEQKQFDFWVGDWDLTSPGSKSGEVLHHHNTINRILGSCIVQENFVGTDAPDQAPHSAQAFLFSMSILANGNKHGWTIRAAISTSPVNSKTTKWCFPARRPVQMELTLCSEWFGKILRPTNLIGVGRDQKIKARLGKCSGLSITNENKC